MSELRTNLNNLLSEIDRGWWSNTRMVRFGEGGCLLTAMRRMQERQGAIDADPYAALNARVAMRTALGFFTGPAMYDWNDAQTGPAAIKARINEALNANCAEAAPRVLVGVLS